MFYSLQWFQQIYIILFLPHIIGRIEIFINFSFWPYVDSMFEANIPVCDDKSFQKIKDISQINLWEITKKKEKVPQ